MRKPKRPLEPDEFTLEFFRHEDTGNTAPGFLSPKRRKLLVSGTVVPAGLKDDVLKFCAELQHKIYVMQSSGLVAESLPECREGRKSKKKRDSDLICTRCNLPINRCTCSDKDTRLKQAGIGDTVAARWCRKCDQHYAFCRCEQPDWCMKVHGRFEPLPDSICDDLGIPRQNSKWKTLADKIK